MSHLSRDERLLALDGALDGTRQAHLAGCPACRTDVETLGRVLARVRAVDVPEPSPLFWDHLAARVGDAIAREPAPVPDRGWWSPRLAWAAAAVVIVSAGAGYLTRSPLRPATAVVAHAPSAVQGRATTPPPRTSPMRPPPSTTAGPSSRRSPTRSRPTKPSHRRSGRPSCRSRRCPPTSAGPWRASWPPNWRRAGIGKDDRDHVGQDVHAGCRPRGRGARRITRRGRRRRRAAAPSAGRGRLAGHGRPADRHRDRRRTRTSIRPSSGGCSTPTR